MSDTKKKISAWIPAALYDKLETIGYNSPTIAVTKALEMLVKAESGDNQETIGDNLGTIRTQMQAEIDSLQNDIERLTLALQEAPNPIELVKLQGKYEGFQMLLDEKEKRIESLENDLKKADLDKEDLKNMHNNYFLQVQTLINQKAIGSPKEEVRKHQEAARKTQEASKPAAQKENKTYDYEVQEVPDIETEKKSKVFETICLNCGTSFAAERKTRKFCSGKCKTAYHRKNEK